MTAIAGSILHQNNTQLMMAQMFNKMNSADIDGKEGLSLAELASIDISDDKGGEKFLKDLQEQFNTLDADFDGQLSKDEMSYAKFDKSEIGMPAGMNISNAESDEEINPYRQLINSLMSSLVSNLDKDGDGKISEDELKSGFDNLSKKIGAISSEVAGTVADSNLGNMAGGAVKNMAGNFIQGLINNYKDNGGLGQITSAINSLL